MRSRSRRTLAWVLAALALVGLAAPGARADEPSIRLAQARARHAIEPDARGRAGSEARGYAVVYVRITNLAKEPDTLLSATADAAGVVEMHEAGELRSPPVSRIAIPAEGTVALKPGGPCLVLRRLARKLELGDKVNVTLTFERARPVSFLAQVLEAR